MPRPGDAAAPSPSPPDPSGPTAGRRPPAPAARATAPSAPPASAGGPDEVTAEEEAALAAHLEELRGQLLSTPPEVVVANHAYGLFELAALHLSSRPPGFDQARLAIDALGALVEGLAGRLGQAEQSLVDALAQIRLAYVQIQAGGAPEAPPD